MRRRAVAAAVLTLLLAGGVVALRGNGLLGGRDHDGPLFAYAGSLVMNRPAGRSLTFNDTRLENRSRRTVRLESITPLHTRGGLQVVGIRLQPFDDGHVGYSAFPPPRRRTIPVHGARIPPGAGWSVALGLSAREPGRATLRGLRIRYRIGSRAFDERVDTIAGIQARAPGVNFLLGFGVDVFDVDESP